MKRFWLVALGLPGVLSAQERSFRWDGSGFDHGRIEGRIDHRTDIEDFRELVNNVQQYRGRESNPHVLADSGF